MGSMADSPVAIGSLRFVLFAPVGGIDRRVAARRERNRRDCALIAISVPSFHRISPPTSVNPGRSDGETGLVADAPRIVSIREG